jgi:hypothetical protein
MNREVLVFMATLLLLGPLVAAPARGRADRTATTANILVNSDFDLGPGPPWVEYSKLGYSIISHSDDGVPIDPVSEPYLAWFGGAYDAYDVLYQDVAIPAYATSVMLSGYRYILYEPSQDMQLRCTLDVNDTLMFVWEITDPTPFTWVYFAMILNQYIGETIRLRIIAWTNPTTLASVFIDSLELNIEYLEIPDVAVTDVVTSKTGCLPAEVVGEGRDLSINVTIANQGTLTETFSVAVFANGTQVDSQLATLSPAEVATLTFTWNTLGFLKGNYMIAAVADAVAGENDTADNAMNYGYTLLTLAGDVDGDRAVDIFDIVRMAGVYGVTKPDPRYDPNCDVDGDGDIDIFDLVAAAGHYGDSW